MAYQAPALRPKKFPPTFSSGYATHDASEAGGALWKGLTVAFAPFLGPVDDPTKLLFGKGVRPNATFSGGKSSPGGLGWAWELTTVNDVVKLATIENSIGIRNVSMLIGYRKTDSTLRNGGIWGANLGTFDANTCWLRHLNDGRSQLDFASGAAAVTFAGGFSQLTDHVYGWLQIGNPAGQTSVYMVDGEPAFTLGITNVRSGGATADIQIGNNVSLITADLIQVNFCYVWNEQLSLSQMARISADPGMMFRPSPMFYPQSKVTVTGAALAADITGDGTVSADLGELVSLSAAIAGDATVHADPTLAAPLSAALAGSGAVSANAGLLENLAAGLAGSAAVAANLNASAPMSAALRGTAEVVAELSGAPPAFMAEDGGLGRDPLGDPLGGGGPLHVVRARAIDGQTVRVVVDEEPLHQGSAGLNDALNPSNYSFAITTGTGLTPLAVGVKQQLVPGPAVAVDPTQWGIDVQTDRQLIIGLTYEVQVGLNVQAKAGGSVAAPGTAPFSGIVKLADTSIVAVRASFSDFDNPPARGSWFVDDSGDITVAGGQASLKKRIIRRLATPKGAFKFLPAYGLALQLKETASLAQVAALKLDAAQQIRQEPEVAAASVTATISGNNVLSIQTVVRTKLGAVVEAGIQVTLGQQGFTVI